MCSTSWPLQNQEIGLSLYYLFACFMLLSTHPAFITFLININSHIYLIIIRDHRDGRMNRSWNCYTGDEDHFNKSTFTNFNNPILLTAFSTIIFFITIHGHNFYHIQNIRNKHTCIYTYTLFYRGLFSSAKCIVVINNIT